MDIKSTHTLTGLTLEEAQKKLDEQLPSDAYKPVPGAADLTDIDPNYMRKVLNEVFGLCGLGWGYSYEPSDMLVEIEERAGRNGKRRLHVATLKHLRFWYKVIGSDGQAQICQIDASGGSDNEVEGYAMKGAITNALGNAASNIGFQESVYLGKRSHKTVAKTPAKAAASTPASKKAVQVAAKDGTVEAPVANADPDGYVIQIGQRAGKKLGEQPREIIEWYANSMPAGSDAQKKALQAAARSWLIAHPNGVKPAPVPA